MKKICRNCIERYLLSIQVFIPQCMECKVGWNMDFIYANLSTNFYSKKYPAHRTEILLQQQKARLPGDQADLARRREFRDLAFQMRHVDHLERIISRKLKSILCLNICARYYNLLQEKDYYLRNKNRVKAEAVAPCPKEDCRGFLIKSANFSDANLASLNKKISELKPLIEQIEKEINSKLGEGTLEDSLSSISMDEKKMEGHDTSMKLQCTICKTVACLDCHQELSNSHVCNPETKQTVSLLKNDSKPCPNCRVLITKIDGCDQMWCVQCHKTFSWRSGMLTTERVHNPHYYEWQRRVGAQAREVGDMPCGGPVTYTQISKVILKDPELCYEINAVSAYHRFVEHMRACLADNRTNGEVPETELVEFRLNYLENQINLSQWKDRLKRSVKKWEKIHSVYMIMRMFVDMADVIFIKIVREPSSALVGLKELVGLRTYVQEQLSVAKNRYKNVMPTLYDNMDWDDRTHLMRGHYVNLHSSPLLYYYELGQKFPFTHTNMLLWSKEKISELGVLGLAYMFAAIVDIDMQNSGQEWENPNNSSLRASTAEELEGLLADKSKAPLFHNSRRGKLLQSLLDQSRYKNYILGKMNGAQFVQQYASFVQIRNGNGICETVRFEDWNEYEYGIELMLYERFQNYAEQYMIVYMMRFDQNRKRLCTDFTEKIWKQFMDRENT
jgi:hypothetical protein